MDPRDLASKIDHTVLKPTATAKNIDKLCEEAAKYNFIAVCVNPIWVARAKNNLSGSEVKVCSVIGFPLGTHRTDTKVDETRRAIDDGASEIDMVINMGELIAGNVNAVRDDIATIANAVHAANPNYILKVILESAALTDDQVVAACKASVEARADFVKTSTGFHAAGGATVHHVKLMARSAPGLQVKASGGIRTWASIRMLIDAGANRIGASVGPKIMDMMKRLTF